MVAAKKSVSCNKNSLSSALETDLEIASGVRQEKLIEFWITPCHQQNI